MRGRFDKRRGRTRSLLIEPVWNRNDIIAVAPVCPEKILTLLIEPVWNRNKG